MKSIINNNQGYTLIEVILVLILVGLFTAGVGLGIVAVTKGYIYAGKNAQMTQKVNIAMERISLELQGLTFISSASSSSVTFTSPDGTQTLGFDSDSIKLAQSPTALADGDLLMDEVVSLNLSFINDSSGTWQITDSINTLVGITVAIEVLRDDLAAGSMTFTATIFLRNNNNAGGTI